LFGARPRLNHVAAERQCITGADTIGGPQHVERIKAGSRQRRRWLDHLSICQRWSSSAGTLASNISHTLPAGCASFNLHR